MKFGSPLRSPEELLTALAPHLPSTPAGLHVLDLGCGTGLAGELLRPWAAKKAIEADYKLTDSGRYAHHPNYVREIATQAGFVPLSQNETSIREEYGETVVGIVTVLRGPSSTTRP